MRPLWPGGPTSFVALCVMNLLTAMPRSRHLDFLLDATEAWFKRAPIAAFWIATGVGPQVRMVRGGDCRGPDPLAPLHPRVTGSIACWAALSAPGSPRRMSWRKKSKRLPAAPKVGARSSTTSFANGRHLNVIVPIRAASPAPAAKPVIEIAFNEFSRLRRSQLDQLACRPPRGQPSRGIHGRACGPSAQAGLTLTGSEAVPHVLSKLAGQCASRRRRVTTTESIQGRPSINPYGLTPDQICFTFVLILR